MLQCVFVESIISETQLGSTETGHAVDLKILLLRQKSIVG